VPQVPADGCKVRAQVERTSSMASFRKISVDQSQLIFMLHTDSEPDLTIIGPLSIEPVFEHIRLKSNLVYILFEKYTF
jgi:hypothetical protein